MKIAAKQQISNDQHFSMLFVTREKYPTHRVDLTELFSAGIATRGWQIDWIMQSLQPRLTSVVECGQRERVFIGPAVSRNGLLSKTINFLLDVLHDLTIWRIGRSGAYDLIQVRDKFFASLVALVTARTIHVPFFYWMSFPFPEQDLYLASDSECVHSNFLRWCYRIRGNLTKLLLYKVILPNADHVFAQSNKMKKSLVNKQIDSDSITPVPMGVSFTRLNQNKVKPSKDRKLVGRMPVVYVGTLNRTRRIDFLIRAFRLVHKRVPKALLVLVGNANETDMLFLKNEVELCGLRGHVVFTGFLPLQKAWAYIRAAAVVVSPIPPNPIMAVASPTKIIEYMALGKPVVASDHPDQSKVIAESGGGIAVPYDINKFADGIVAVLQDPRQADAMGARGRKYVRKHRSYEGLSEMLEQKYRMLLRHIKRD